MRYTKGEGGGRSLAAGAAGVLLAAAACGCEVHEHVLYRVSSDYVESGRQWVWPHFLQGKPTVVAFWNTDVAQCLRDIPVLKGLDVRTNVELVTVVTGLDRYDVEKWVHRYGLSYVVLLDLEKKLASELGVASYPMFIYFDTSGSEIARASEAESIGAWFNSPRWLRKSGAEIMPRAPGATQGTTPATIDPAPR
jgi:thiol-disulfide isomerase/thioredoxin